MPAAGRPGEPQYGAHWDKAFRCDGPRRESQDVLVAFNRWASKERLWGAEKTIRGMARAERFRPQEIDDALQRTMELATRHLTNQANGHATSMELRESPGIEGWLVAIAKGNVIRSMLRDQFRNREDPTPDCGDLAEKSHEEIAAHQSIDEWETLLASIDIIDRYLFELNKGWLPVTPSAASVIAHASRLGLPPTDIESLGRRARLLTWPKRKGSIVTQEELSVLMTVPLDDVTKRIRETLQYLAKNGDRKKRAG